MSKTTDPFLMRATDKIEALRREIALLEAQEAGVRRRRLELEKDATDWQRSVELYNEAMGVEAPASATSDDRPKETVAEMITTYLSEQPGRSAKVATIAAWLAERGKFPAGQSDSGQNYSMAYNALLRNRDKFEKSAKGEWRLIVRDVHAQPGPNGAA